MPVINTIELEGVSDKSWGDAAREALREAAAERLQHRGVKDLHDLLGEVGARTGPGR